MKQTKEKISKLFLRLSSGLPNYVNMLKINPLFLKIFFILFLFFSSIAGTNIKSEAGILSTEVSEEPMDPKEVYAKEVKSRIYQSLYIQVDEYMNLMAPESKLDPDLLTKKCLEYNIDIVFVLAQGILESHLGTKGKAAVTNSVWNVGTYDNGQILYIYNNPNESIEPYLELLKRKYLINVTSKGDTIYKDLHHLVEDRGYINYKGARFASAVGYENSMRKLIIKIDMETSIGFYQDLYEMKTEDIISYFVPDNNLEINYSIL
jgi:hypothetical protein